MILTEKRLSFKKFIKKADECRLFGGTPVGDFIDDASTDKGIKSFSSKKKLIAYLESQRGACAEAIEAGGLAYDIWKDTHGRMTNG